MKVILGAGKTVCDGWMATQESDLNLLSDDDWDRLFTPESIDAFLAEHVWEHLTLDEGVDAAQRCFRFDTRNSMEALGMVSLIVDARKPLVIRHQGDVR